MTVIRDLGARELGQETREAGSMMWRHREEHRNLQTPQIMDMVEATSKSRQKFLGVVHQEDMLGCIAKKPGPHRGET